MIQVQTRQSHVILEVTIQESRLLYTSRYISVAVSFLWANACSSSLPRHLSLVSSITLNARMQVYPTPRSCIVPIKAWEDCCPLTELGRGVLLLNALIQSSCCSTVFVGKVAIGWLLHPWVHLVWVPSQHTHIPHSIHECREDSHYPCLCGIPKERTDCQFWHRQMFCGIFNCLMWFVYVSFLNGQRGHENEWIHVTGRKTQL